MTASQYLSLCAAIYLAPRVSARTSWIMAAVCLAAAVVFKVGEQR